MFYYFLTCDYACTSKGLPTKKLYYEFIAWQFTRFNLSLTDNDYPVKCFEYKHKSKKYPLWLHWHGIVQTNKLVPYILAACPNLSVKYVRIYNMKTMAFYAGYIQKQKTDYVDIHPLKTLIDGELKK